MNGASDAGIYVGQSRNIIVRAQPRRVQRRRHRDRELHRRRRLRQRRHQQHRRHPGLQPARAAGAGRPAHARLQQPASTTTTRRTSAPRAAACRGVPTGTGTIVLANDEVEIFDNDFRDNDTIAHPPDQLRHRRRCSGRHRPTTPTSTRTRRPSSSTTTPSMGGGTNPPADLDAAGRTQRRPAAAEHPLRRRLRPRQGGRRGAARRRCAPASSSPGATFLNLDLGQHFANVSKDLETVNCTHRPAAAGGRRHAAPHRDRARPGCAGATAHGADRGAAGRRHPAQGRHLRLHRRRSR